MNNKFEQLLELLVNEEQEKAEALFHEIVVEKSRDIYEGLADSEATTEAMHDKKDKKDMKEEEVSEETASEAMHGKKDKEMKKESDESEQADEEVACPDHDR